MNYFLGVDIGTTSTKAIAFSHDGAIKAKGSQGYEIIVPHPTWAEQDPEALFNAVITSVRQAMGTGISKQEIAAVGFSAATHSLLPVDANNKPLSNIIIWADNRSVTQTERLKQEEIAHNLYLRTGSPIHPVSVVTKLMWLREKAPEIFHKAAKFISIKEYIFFRLFQRYVVDYSIASATGLFNLKQLNWDAEALTIAGIKPEQLSQLVSTTHILRGMQTEYAEAMGLDPHTPVIIGANDGVLANLGVGAIAPSEFAITIGTSGAVRTVAAEPITDPQMRTFCYALTEKHWAIGGPTNNGGIVLRWLRDRFCHPEVEEAKRLGIDPYDVMIQAAMEIPAGAEGLICLPYLSGERAPYWNPKARGVFFGLNFNHTRSHTIRAAMEGIIFAVYSINVAIQEIAGTTGEIRASGGFARSHAWLQMMADAFGMVVAIPEVYEASGYGAAVLAMYAVGAIADLSEVQPTIKIRDRISPNPDLTRTYHQLFSRHQRLYRQLEAEF
ncbi:gluconokinase [Chroococcidiopsis sp. CCNUC1]|uniref:gluconokinase n=1 Tax=Chroococcidiopsis sp. CCNUC1 TaxID=2653189 RepID=UPI002020E66E|nr:FGGY family carbohydrate kinase [Chroococcidiopsis sp. CCNUC1]URD52211.1 gluconokinase [Chroococcidiopsis sp. CCNUC1]